jgi:hypothetical protein
VQTHVRWAVEILYSISPGRLTLTLNVVPRSSPHHDWLRSPLSSCPVLPGFTFGTAVFPYTTHRSTYPSNKIIAVPRSDARSAIYPEISRTSFYGSIESLSSPVFAGCRLIFVLISGGPFPGSHTGDSCAVERPRFLDAVVCLRLAHFKYGLTLNRF